jgi:hypothetical protein
MHLVRLYAGKVRVLPQVRIDRVALRPGVLSGVIPWAAATTRGVRRVDFRVDGDLVLRDTRRPFVVPRLNTTNLANGTHVLEVHAYGRAGIDVWRKRVRIRNEAFVLRTNGVAPRQTVAGVVHLGAVGAGAAVRSASLWVDGKLVQRDARAPFVFAWNSRTVRNTEHTLAIRAQARDGRVAWSRALRISVLNPVTAPGPPAQIVGQSLADGQTVSGIVQWQVQVRGPAQRVDFYVDGIRRASVTYLPFKYAWDTQAETPGSHALEVRLVRPDLSVTSAKLTVTVAASGG